MKDTNAIEEALRSKCKKEINKVVDEIKRRIGGNNIPIISFSSKTLQNKDKIIEQIFIDFKF